MTDEQLEAKLTELAEPKYRDFSGKLTPTAYPMLGVRIPALRKLAVDAPPPAEIRPTSFEKVMVRGFATARAKLPIGAYLDGVEAFLPYIDNWAVCDCVTSSLKPVAKNRAAAYDRFLRLADAGSAWERRFLAVLLMDYYLDEEYIDRVLDVYRDMRQGEYYVDMAIAWALSVALVKFYDKTRDRLAAGTYSTFVTNKAIQKARESYRIPPERKAELTAYKRR